ncbi:MAG: FtsQ-type POTRA domain-containing protein [Anaerolineales bacterium]|nr:FtsQ-type POTRA domain-containing protein [Anaerolineales bacterium]
MTTSRKPTRAEIVRRRRQQEMGARFQAVVRQATGGVRPLVSRPRRTAGGLRPIGRKRRWEISFGGDRTFTLPDLDLAEMLGRIAGTWRMYSLALVTLLVALLLYTLTERSFYVTSLNLGGAALVPQEEIYAASGLAGQHVFWVNPAEVTRKVVAVPGIASATITVTYPAKVELVVVERVPKVMLIEGAKKWWVDAAGQKFLSRGDLPGLLPIISESATELEALPPEAVLGALLLKQLRQNIEKLYYDPLHGLSYQDGRGWRGYFGVGADMEKKLAVYEALVEQLMQRGEYPVKISVENLDAPYYKK